MVTIITLDTKITCVVPVTGTTTGDYVILSCDSDVHAGCSVMYRYRSQEGCIVAAYDGQGKCLFEHIFDASHAGDSGGGFSVTYNMSYIKFSSNASLFKTTDLTVSELIDGARDSTELYERLELYQVDEQYWQDIVNLYLDNNAGGGASCLDMYPIGSIYLASINSDPSKLFGGNWTPLYGLFHESVYAWTRIEDYSIAIADLAIADLAICAEDQPDDASIAIVDLAIADLAICA